MITHFNKQLGAFYRQETVTGVNKITEWIVRPFEYSITG